MSASETPVTGPIPRGEAWDSEAVVSPPTTLQAQMGKVFGYIKGVHATHLIDVGARLGLFRRLAEAEAGLMPTALAAELGFDPAYVQRWCETACALELLDYDPAGGYRLAPEMDEVLGRPDGTFYLGSFPELHLLFARDYARLPELFRSGGTYPFQEHDEAFLTGLARATKVLPRMFLSAVMPRLPDLAARLEGGASLLDVGCGAGYALVEFAERYPRARCVGIDVEPTSIGMARELIRERGLDGRVEAHVVDGAEWPVGLAGAFDVVSMFAVLHEIRPELKAAVLARCVEALRPGGLLLIFDERYPGRPTELRDPEQLFTVIAQWFEGHWGNVVNSREQILAMLAEQGLRVLDETGLSRFYIVTAEKPAG